MKIVYVNGMVINFDKMATVKAIDLCGSFAITAVEPDGTSNIFLRDLPSEEYATELLLVLMRLLSNRKTDVVIIDESDLKNAMEKVELTLEEKEKKKLESFYSELGVE